ncbi:MAG TPA: adenine deaminase [Candidatus Kapabacteria bacterium]|nr:adenine deaminase [Candidatus Kapabacteria bacterium]
MEQFSVFGNLVDLINSKIYPAKISIADKKIVSIEPQQEHYDTYILPGLIDAHIHIDSSMLPPSEFARMASVHGTVATVSDPHEIANVLGKDGVRFMIENAKQTHFKFYFGAPSCVPATDFETSGAKLTAADIEELFSEYDLKYLSEMMNFPGVIYDNPDVLAKIDIAKKFNKPIDGHAPGLRGEDARKYAQAGISTDHECFDLEEAREKIRYGMNILIREGSAAKNFETLAPLLNESPDKCMLCSDDLHPDDLAKGHINLLVKRAIAMGTDPIKVLKIATLNPIKHYGLDVGLLQVGDPADFIVIDNFNDFNILQTYIDGELVADNGKSLLSFKNSSIINNFQTNYKNPNDFKLSIKNTTIPVIKAIDGSLITERFDYKPVIIEDDVKCDLSNDILKIAVVNRYKDVKPAVWLINNFGLKRGAIATSVAHDSHNLIAVGVDNFSITEAINALIDTEGGMAVYDGTSANVLPLPIAGLMSNDDGWYAARKYEELNQSAKLLGTHLTSPFMTLSFMSLLVIPKLKLGDQGLFDVEKFAFV